MIGDGDEGLEALAVRPGDEAGVEGEGVGETRRTGAASVLRFAGRFLLPLVSGGTLHVGRPLGQQAVARMARGLWADPLSFVPAAGTTALIPYARKHPPPSYNVLRELQSRRHAVATSLLAGARPPPLDATALRLAAALHNLLALTHPGIDGHGVDARQERIAAVALKLAAVGPPATAIEAVNRHSLLGRLGEIGRSDRVVHYWLGRRAFVGRVPPPRITALPRLRRVHVDTVRRGWLREIGIPACARPAFLELAIASPLGDVEDLFRLDPPLAWSRLLEVLRFPPLCRLVASRVADQGVDRSGDALADALFRFAARQDPLGGVQASADAVAFAIRFLAHCVWLDLLFSRDGAAASGARVGVPATGAAAGLDLAVVLVAAQRISPALVWPPDVATSSELGQRFVGRLAAMAEKVRVRRSPRFDAAVAMSELAAQSQRAGVIVI